VCGSTCSGVKAYNSFRLYSLPYIIRCTDVVPAYYSCSAASCTPCYRVVLFCHLGNPHSLSEHVQYVKGLITSQTAITVTSHHTNEKLFFALCRVLLTVLLVCCVGFTQLRYCQHFFRLGWAYKLANWFGRPSVGRFEFLKKLYKICIFPIKCFPLRLMQKNVKASDDSGYHFVERSEPSCRLYYREWNCFKYRLRLME
jgi:hypothetical protein